MAMEVQKGQVWADNDKRAGGAGRKLRVELIDDRRAKCWSYYGNPVIGRYVWIRLDRFKPNSTGYKLIEVTTPTSE